MNNATVTYNDKEIPYYDATQMQRRLEREIRKEKKDILYFNSLDGDKAKSTVNNISVGLKNKEIKYKDFSKQTGLLTQNERLRVTNFGRSEAQKAVHASKEMAKNLENGVKPITDKAVYRLKDIKLDGFSKEQNQLILNQHRELLNASRGQNYNREVAFVLNKDLERNYIKPGKNLSVEGVKIKEPGSFVLHNHPNNSGFSRTDIETFVKNDKIKHLSVIGNDGTLKVLTKTADYDSMKIKKELDHWTEVYKITGQDYEGKDLLGLLKLGNKNAIKRSTFK